MKTDAHRMTLAIALMVGSTAPAAAASFDVYIPTHLKHQGGYTETPGDPDGTTNKGITLSTFKRYSQSLLNIPPTAANLKALTDAQAGIIYKKDDWDPVHGDEIALQELANIVFDFEVDRGTGEAVKLLQKTLNGLGASPPFQITGTWTPSLLAALNKMDQRVVFTKFQDGCIKFYEDEVAKRPELNKYLKGWKSRVYSFHLP